MKPSIADDKVYAFIRQAVDNLSIDRQLDHPHPLSRQHTQVLHSLAVAEIDHWQGQRDVRGERAA